VFLTVSWFIFGMYGISWILYIIDFKREQNLPIALAQKWFGIVLLIHFLFLIYIVIDYHRIPVASISETFLTFVWLTASMYWVLEIRLKERSMGAFMMPLLLVTLAISNITYHQNIQIADVLKDVRFEIHVLAIILAYGAFVISFIASLLYIILEREIKKSDLGLFYSRLPSLAFFERISNSSVDIGFVVAGFGLILGTYFAINVWDKFFFSDLKFIAAVINWLIYGVHFLSRRFMGWRGKRAAFISVSGFIWLIFSFMIISTLFTKVHHFV